MREARKRGARASPLQLHTFFFGPFETRGGGGVRPSCRLLPPLFLVRPARRVPVTLHALPAGARGVRGFCP